MLKTRITLASLLAIAAMASASATTAAAMPIQSRGPRGGNGRGRGYKTRRRIGKRYPEQSSRQAMRGQRRAQGGPGLVLVDGAYQARG